MNPDDVVATSQAAGAPTSPDVIAIAPRDVKYPPLLFLDGLRGLAAAFVMLHHARWLLWEGMAEGYSLHPEKYSMLGKTLAKALSVFRYGHEAVIFFFVLSGFVIHFGYAKKLSVEGAKAHFDGASYLVRRARRLYPPLIFAMLLTYTLDRIGMSLGYPIYSGQTLYPVINGAIQPHHDALTALGNLAFLMQAWVPCWGTDGPLWSLHFEWWFYMLYPLLWLLSRRSVALAGASVGTLFVLSLRWPDWPLPGLAAHAVPEIFAALLTWSMGALLADVVTKRTTLPLAWLAVFAPLLLLIPVTRHDHGWMTSTLYGLGFTGLLALGLILHARGISLRWLDRLKPLGDMSYTLYITHLPIFVLLSGWLMSRTPEGTLPMHFGWMAAGALLTMVIAYAAHFLVEKPFLSRARPRAA
jgi:peptidoglycan/LPS O-acetylase OafA/YrhL